jgi:hypothetical protein
MAGWELDMVRSASPNAEIGFTEQSRIGDIPVAGKKVILTIYLLTI